MGNKPFYDIDLNDAEILGALAKAGGFITDYVSGGFLTSRMWSELPEYFIPGDENRRYLDQIHSGDREKISRSLVDLFNGRITDFHEIYPLLSSDGRYRWVLSVGQTVKTAEGNKPLLFVGADSDITELKGAEEKLRTSVEEEKKRAGELETLRQILREGYLCTEGTEGFVEEDGVEGLRRQGKGLCGGGADQGKGRLPGP